MRYDLYTFQGFQARDTPITTRLISLFNYFEVKPFDETSGQARIRRDVDGNVSSPASLQLETTSSAITSSYDPQLCVYSTPGKQ